MPPLCLTPSLYPLFKDSNWCGKPLKDDKRCAYGISLACSTNYTWAQHFIHHLAPHGNQMGKAAR